MTPEQYAIVQDHFLQLRALPDEQRGAALANLDSKVRAEVKAMLESDLACGDFLGGNLGYVLSSDNPAASDADTHSHAPGSLKELHHVGRYKLLQKIGEGGHGTVYMAEQQEPIHRKVAVKVIKPGMDTKQVLARFHAEQQALAMMDHTSIAKVLDAGATDAGTPYFVMELVKGVPIHHFCADTKANLSQRLALFLQVCDAVHHAHRKGIIHRDLKPSNVLVTMGENEPIAKVIDFGIAKALDQRLTPQTLFTEYGQIIGTLEYMSPEQAEMSAVEVDTRSDVYSLGVLLYQLLTGETPISRKQLMQNGFLEIARLLRETEPAIPSARITMQQRQLTQVDRHHSGDGLKSLPSGELDWIALKALAKDRRQRYDSVLDLARDVKRFLGGEPVEAHPPSFFYRAAKTLRKHKIPVAMGAVLAVGCLVGMLGLVLGIQRARLAALDAQRQRAVALAASEKAQSSQRELATNVYSQMVNSAWRAAAEHKDRRARELLNDCPTSLRGWEWSLATSVVDDRTALQVANEGWSVRRMEVCAENDQVACVLQDGTVEIWDYLRNQRVSRLEFETRANVVRWVQADFDSDHAGVFALVGTSGGTVSLVRVRDGETIWSQRIGIGGIYDIAVSYSHLVICGGSGQTKLFTHDRFQEPTFQKSWDPGARFAGIAFVNHDIVGAGLDGKVYFLDMFTDEIMDVPVSQTSVQKVQPLPFRTTLGTVLAMTEDSAVIIDKKAQQANTVISINGNASAMAAVRSSVRGGTKIPQTDACILLANGAGRLVKREIKSPEVAQPIGNLGSAITQLEWIPARRELLAALADGRVVWIDLNASPLRGITPPADAAIQQIVPSAGVVLHRHSQLVGFDGSGTMQVFSMESGELVMEKEAHDNAVWAATTDDQESIMVTVGEDQQLRCWELPEMELRFACPVAWGVRDACVAPDGSWIASAPDPDPDPENYPREGTVVIRDANTGDVLRTLVGHENWVLKMAVSVDGAMLATSGEFPNTRIWNVATGTQHSKFEYSGRAPAPHVMFDPRPGSDIVYLGHRDGWVTSWANEDGPWSAWPAFGDAISGLHATRDYRVIASSRSSSQLKVFQQHEKREKAILEMGQGALLGFHVARDDRTLVTVGKDQRLGIYRLPPEPAKDFDLPGDE